MPVVYYKSPDEAYDNCKIPIYVEETYEPVMPKIFGMTNTPPLFEDHFNKNMAFMNVSLRILVDIHTGGYVYRLEEAERDVPRIIQYLKWFVDTFQCIRLTPEQKLTIEKVTTTYSFFSSWARKVEAAKQAKENKGNRTRSFAEGGYVK